MDDSTIKQIKDNLETLCIKNCTEFVKSLEGKYQLVIGTENMLLTSSPLYLFSWVYLKRYEILIIFSPFFILIDHTYLYNNILLITLNIIIGGKNFKQQ